MKLVPPLLLGILVVASCAMAGEKSTTKAAREIPAKVDPKFNPETGIEYVLAGPLLHRAMHPGSHRLPDPELPRAQQQGLAAFLLAREFAYRTALAKQYFDTPAQFNPIKDGWHQVVLKGNDMKSRLILEVNPEKKVVIQKRVLTLRLQGDAKPPLRVVELPRPNSGEISFEQTEARKSEILSNAPTPPLELWKNPCNSFCIHIHKDDSITAYSRWDEDLLDEHKKPAPKVSVAEIGKMVDWVPRSEAPVGVLITSDRPLRESKVIQKLLKVLFVPGVQLFYARDNGRGGTAKESLAIQSGTNRTRSATDAER